MTTNVFVISEYTSPDREKQVIFERICSGASYYRVTSIVRCASMDAAKSAYMKLIPSPYHPRALDEIDAYTKARKRGQNPPAEATPKAPPIPKKKRGRPAKNSTV